MNTDNLSPAAYVRCFIAFHKQALLSTLSKRFEGTPFGSVIPYDVDSSGRIIISVSKLSEHYKNLEEDGRASILVQQRYFEHEPRKGGRVTLLLRFDDVPEGEYGQAAESYRNRYGAAAEFELAHDFVLKRGEVQGVRWIQGFGRMGWLDPEEYRAGVVDCIAPSGLEAVEHMNADHQDSVCQLVRAYSEEELPADDVELKGMLVGIDSRGMVVQYLEGKELAIPFEPVLTDSSELRARVVELVKDSQR